MVIGGGPLDPRVVAGIDAACCPIVAADSGLDHARAAGLVPSVVVGDMDSISADGLAWARSVGMEMVEHSPDKDRTDTELALAYAAVIAERIIVLAGDGDRIDHTLGAITALGHRSLSGAEVCGWWANTFVRPLHGPTGIELRCPPGTVFSLLALHGPCRGIDVRGARWPLRGAGLEPGRSHAVSNIVAEGERAASVFVGEGVLTVVVPDGSALDLTDPLEEHEG